MEITSLIVGLIIGVVISSIILYLLIKTKNVSKREFDELSEKHNETVTNLRLFENKTQILQETNDSLSSKLTMKENDAVKLQTKTTSLEEKLSYSESKINELSHHKRFVMNWPRSKIFQVQLVKFQSMKNATLLNQQWLFKFTVLKINT